MADYGKKIQSDNKHLANTTSARKVHIDGSSTVAQTIRSTGGRLLRVILNTNGATVTLRDGSDVIGIIAADAPEGTFNYGVYCNQSIIVQAGGAVDATIVFSD
jgi:hypothetical protein